MRSVDCSNALFALERQSFRPGYSAGRDRFKIDTEKKLKRPPKAASVLALTEDSQIVETVRVCADEDAGMHLAVS